MASRQFLNIWCTQARIIIYLVVHLRLHVRYIILYHFNLFIRVAFRFVAFCRGSLGGMGGLLPTVAIPAAPHRWTPRLWRCARGPAACWLPPPPAAPPSSLQHGIAWSSSNRIFWTACRWIRLDARAGALVCICASATKQKHPTWWCGTDVALEAASIRSFSSMNWPIANLDIPHLQRALCVASAWYHMTAECTQCLGLSAVFIPLLLGF